MLEPREYFREQLYTKLDIPHKLKDQTVPKFQCHINLFTPPTITKRIKNLSNVVMTGSWTSQGRVGIILLFFGFSCPLSFGFQQEA